MQILLAITFGILLVAEVGFLVTVSPIVAMFPYLLWIHEPWSAALAGGLLPVALVVAWRSRQMRSRHASAPLPRVHPGISISHIPIAGLPGTLYMLQFLIWLLLSPAVGWFYAALLGGGLLLAPVVSWLNRYRRAGTTAVGGAGLAGMLSALVFMAVAASVEHPPALLLVAAAAAGIFGAPLLIWIRSRPVSLSIAPYRQQAT